MNEKQKEFLAQSGINLTDGLAYFSENERKDSMKSTFFVF